MLNAATSCLWRDPLMVCAPNAKEPARFGAACSRGDSSRANVCCDSLYPPLKRGGGRKNMNDSMMTSKELDKYRTPETSGRFVLQDWVAKVGLKMQSILLSGLRAPDQKTVGIKKCVRWMRAGCQIDADPAKQSYMQPIVMNEDLIQLAIDELEYTPCHYAHHFADAMAVVAYHHPNQEVRDCAYRLHYLVAEEIFHFAPESREVFMKRHEDKI